MNICKIDSCNLKSSGRGWCQLHYMRWYNHGDPLMHPKAEIHGLTKTLEYSSWVAMRKRCLDTNHTYYSHYGARGIAICERWENSFLAFLEDMGKRPNRNYQLERINNDGNYEPDNCRWATKKEQANNRRSSRFFTIYGQTRTMKQWAEQYNLNYNTVAKRINSSGWPIEKALEL